MATRGTRQYRHPDIWEVAIDETQYWDLSGLTQADQDCVEGIYGVYFFDRNLVTHVAEMTGSYWLIHVTDSVRFVDQDSMSDEQMTRIQEYVEDGSIRADDSSHYRHVHEVDAYIEAWKNKPKAWRVYHDGDPMKGMKWSDLDGKGAEDKYRRLMDEVRQGIQSNTRL